MKIFMDEFTEDTGKFKSFQESIAFAYLEGQLGILKNEQGFYQKAYEYHQNSYEKFSRLLGEKHADTCQAMNVLAKTLNDLVRYDEALKFRRQVFNLRKKIFGAEDEETITAMNNLAMTLNDAGNAENYQAGVEFGQKKSSRR
ncbi:MAG: tetratricopeptide repeat protein [Selenomonadaceae bacterium]|nr:tetratricopeptide repeat protein [Selenomonadaceae bacterium]